MIKVCHIVNLITGKSDGVFAYLKTIFSNYDRQKYERILIFQGNPFIEEEIRALGIKVITIPSIDKKFPLGALFALKKVLKEYDPDIIHAHMIKPYIMSGLLNIQLEKKLIFNYHGMFLERNPYYSFAEKKLLQFLHWVICKMKSASLALVPSERSRQLLLSETNLFPAVATYYTGFDNNSLETKTELNGNKRIETSKDISIGLIGRFESEKRFDRAAIILSKVWQSFPDLKINVYGNGPLEDELKTIFHKRGLREITNFHGFVKSKRKIYEHLTLVLISSDREGMPNIIWEAMAFGIPVIASDVGGIREIVETENCGFVYDKDDIDDAVDKISEILTNSHLYQTMSFNGMEAVKSKYNTSNFIARLEKIYSSLAGK